MNKPFLQSSLIAFTILVTGLSVNLMAQSLIYHDEAMTDGIDSVGHRFVVIDQRLCHQVHGQPRNQNGKRNQT